MARRVAITGLGTISGLGVGIDALWAGVCEGRSAVRPIEQMDPAGLGCRIASEVAADFSVRNFVPKHYRKATKVMARDIELAVAAADQAVRHAGIMTPGLDLEAARTYPGDRSGCHIGAGLIAAELNELTEALAKATDAAGAFDIHRWGAEGMTHLTPLWLLKYLPNMLACHVTILHDAQGPSNTITCGEASSGLSIGESMRVIQRGAADLGFCGGAESKINPMAYWRQQCMGRLTTTHNDDPAGAVRPFDAAADGTVLGEGGGILTLEAMDTAAGRGATVIAELIGFGASHSVYPRGRGMTPDPTGKGIAAAIRSALRDAGLAADAVDAIVPSGAGLAAWDAAEAAAMASVFGDQLASIPVCPSKAMVGNCGAGAGGIDVAIAAKMLAEQMLPARINCDAPIADLNAKTAPATGAKLTHVLVFSTSLGGQNAALILKKA